MPHTCFVSRSHHHGESSPKSRRESGADPTFYHLNQTVSPRSMHAAAVQARLRRVRGAPTPFEQRPWLRYSTGVILGAVALEPGRIRPRPCKCREFRKLTLPKMTRFGYFRSRKNKRKKSIILWGGYFCCRCSTMFRLPFLKVTILSTKFYRQEM